MTLPEDQQVVLQAIYGEFKPTAKWPTFQHLDIVLDQEHGIAVEPALMALRDAVLVRVYTPIRPQSEVALRIAGLAHCDGSENDLVLFGRLLQWSVEKERRFRPSSPHEVEQQIVTSDEAAAEWREAGEEVSDLDLQKAYELVAVEMLYEGHGSNGTTWQLNMFPRIRRFRGVRNYDDYLRVIADDEQAQAAAKPAGVAVPRPNRRATTAAGPGSGQSGTRAGGTVPIRRLSAPAGVQRGPAALCHQALRRGRGEGRAGIARCRPRQERLH